MATTQTLTDLDRFHACMDYESGAPRPNHELGVWRQTRERWQGEAPDAVQDYTWDWFTGEQQLALDRRAYIPVNFGFLPPFESAVLEQTEKYEIRRNAKGIVSKALRAGTVDGQRMCMDQYLQWPVRTPADFAAIKKRLVAAVPARYPADLADRIAVWRRRDCPLVLGRNCAANGFYWRAREFMGTEALSYAWYDYPALMHEMMAFYADFIIETSRPVLDKIEPDYFCFNEDFAMKSGPLLGPETFRTFILPHLKRVTAFMRGRGVRHIAVDSDGDPTVLIPLLMDGGVDIIWPIERASGVDPVTWRRRFGRGLRLWGGVDKRVLPRGAAAIRAHLREFIPLIEEGGFIPTVDHTVPPDVSWDDFGLYMDSKRALLDGDFGRLA
ncbi:MAG: hypothetical protein JXR37_24105 [Kiritimatiellae bacterium]|nr:hypothetical protein [Kiritimatiellia bacterium]